MPEGVGYGPQFTASVGKSLSYVGEHAYAFSKRAAANTTPVTALEFTTGSHYIRGSFHLSVGLQDADADSAASYSNIDLNGEGVANMWAGFGGADAMALSQIEMIIPPFTEVSANLYSDVDQPDRFMFISFVGRVYGKDD